MQVQINKTPFRTILALTLSCSLALFMTACGDDNNTPAPVVPTTVTKQAVLTTGLEVPAPTLPDPAAAAPSGIASFTLDLATNKLSGSMTLSGFVSPATAPTDVTAAHIHDGVVDTAGGVVIGLEPNTARDVWSIPATAPALTADQVAKFKAGSYYVNAHTNANGPGLIRGQLISFKDNIQTIFTAKCIECHKPGGTGSALTLLTAETSHDKLVGAFSTTSSPAGRLVVAGDSANSILLQRLVGNVVSGPAGQMPRVGNALPPEEQNLIKAWIDMGAANN